MFGLPILRKYSEEFVAAVEEFEKDRPVMMAYPLGELSGNHYTMGVSKTRLSIIAWGSSGTDGYVKGFSGPSTRPRLSNVKRVKDAITGKDEKGNIKKLTSNGNTSLYLTETGYLYGCGGNPGNIIGARTEYFNLVDSNVDYYDIITCATDQYGGASYLLTIKDGKLYGRGNDYGGFGVAGNKTNFTYLNIDDVKMVYGNAPQQKGKAFVLKKDGTVYATGYNTDGVLGTGSTNYNLNSGWSQVITSDNIPLSGVVDIITSNFITTAGASAGTPWGGVGGNSHQCTIFLTKDGEVYSTGKNNYGQLGLGQGTTYTVNVATKISTLSGIDKICGACGGCSLMAINNKERKVYTWGNNQWGQLGTNDLANKNSPQLLTISFDTGELITNVNGGGNHAIINGAFVMCTNFGNVYSAGYNQTYALGFEGQNIIKVFTKHPYFGPDPTKVIKNFNDTPATSGNRALAVDLDLCGYGSEMAQKVIDKQGHLFMSGWNQNVGGFYNFNQKVGTEKVVVPSVYIMD
jgi:alpha-tubulin suppressor-like RCC1 family protein